MLRERLDHVFLVMVNAVSDLKSAAVERKEMSRPMVKASPNEEFYLGYY